MPYERISDDAARRISRTVLRSESDALRSGSNSRSYPVPLRRSTTEILIRNDSGETVTLGQVLGLGAPIVAPTDIATAIQCDGLPAFAGSTPTVALHSGKWAVVCDTATYSTLDYQHSFTRAVLIGHAVVRVYVTATTDTHVDVSASQTVSSETVYLSTGSNGATILWLDPDAEAETIAYAIVNLGGGGGGGTDLHWGTLDADLEYGDTTGVTVSLDAGGDWTNVLPSKLLESGEYWPSTSKVLVGVVDGVKYVLQGPCPLENS